MKNNFINFLVNAKLFSGLRNFLGKLAIKAISARNGVVIFFDDQERIKSLNLIKKVKQEVKMLVTDHEAYQIYMSVRRTKKIPGAIAEVGAYKGGSAKIICEAKGDKELYLFDTFEGLPDVGDIDIKFKRGQYNSLFEEVKAYLKDYPNVFIYKGVFPATSGPIKDKKFSFVHLDVDIYESTKKSLEFFYPRMSPGGVIISHDYFSSVGVRKAFDDFFIDKPEPILESSRWQCMVVKV